MNRKVAEFTAMSHDISAMIQKRPSKDPASALPWADLRIVKAIGEHGGLTGAASALGINHSTVARRLDVVEQILSVALFDRRRTGYQPTEAGREILALSERVERDIVSVARRVAANAERYAGELRITTSDSLLYDFLTPIVVDFQRINPDIRVEVIISNAPSSLARDLAHGEFDIAVRATLAPPETLFGRRVAQVGWAVYGRRDEFLGAEPDLEELYDRRWASYGSTSTNLRACAFTEQRVAPRNVVYRADSVLGVASALCAGIGVGILPCMHGDPLPSLIRLSPVLAEVSDELWILTHPDIRKSSRVYAFMTHCAEAMTKRRAFIEGRHVYTNRS